MYIINSDKIAANTITIKYFEPGHSYMSADAFHHLVELAMKKKQKIYDFADFVDVVSNHTNEPIVKEMKFNDFKNWLTLTTPYQLQKLNKDRPLLKQVVTIITKRGFTNLFYKEDIHGEEKELHFIPKSKQSQISEAVSRSENRGIDEVRKKTLLKNLSNIIPPHKLVFWKEIAVNNNSSNLVENIEDD